MLEENWFFEALTETYLPLLTHFEMLFDDGVPFRLTLSLTPTLCAMFSDPLLQERYIRHLEKLIELAGKEIDLTGRSEPHFFATARMYRNRFHYLHELYTGIYNRDLVAVFRRFQDLGLIEIITSSATHAFLPNMQHNPAAVEAQVAIAVDDYRRLFGRKPRGIWLPECGYYPGLESILARQGLGYFFVDSHALAFADPEPLRGIYAPLVCKDAPVAAFARDQESSKAVWSADEGYPGAPDYREFYRDIGFERDLEYIGPYIDPIGARVQTGIKYCRVTDRKNPDKQPYRREAALRLADEHAADFVLNRLRRVEQVSPLLDRPPVIVSPYDAELFGHWWYEGPEWLNFLFRKIAYEQDALLPVTPSEYLARHGENQRGTPLFSSWGEGGFSAMWIDKSNDWVPRHLSRMEEHMQRAAQARPDARGLLRRALNQLVRELLLAESSDWTFIMKTGTMVPYAKRRVKEHIENFFRIEEAIAGNRLDASFIAALEERTPLFPGLDYSVYARPREKAGRQ
jgi:1,4-alpha-glucan branching enzyme